MIRAKSAGKSSKESRGHSLLELVVALPLMTMLLLGIASAIKISVSAIPNASGPAAAALATSLTLEAIAADIGSAHSVTTDVNTALASRELAFLIPDRDGQAPSTEAIQYSWSGVPGAPLLRSFNGVDTIVANDVQEFSLAYDKRTVPINSASSSTAGETLLISADGTSSSLDNSITTTDWHGQYFLPLFSSNVIGWNVTKVEIRMMRDGSTTGQTYVQIRTAANEVPTHVVLGQQTLLESSLTANHELKTFTFDTVPMQSPQTGLCLVLEMAANSPSGSVRSWSGGNPFSKAVSTTNGGSVWSTNNSRSLRYKVYGNLWTASTDTTYQYRLTNARCTLRLGSSPNNRLTTSIRIPNEPVVLGP